jgi:hypothetical protein
VWSSEDDVGDTQRVRPVTARVKPYPCAAALHSGRYLHFVSTRTLLILAAITGLAILIAFAVQVLLV